MADTLIANADLDEQVLSRAPLGGIDSAADTVPVSSLLAFEPSSARCLPPVHLLLQQVSQLLHASDWSILTGKFAPSQLRCFAKERTVRTKHSPLRS